MKSCARRVVSKKGGVACGSTTHQKPRERRGRVNHQKVNIAKLINYISPLPKQTHTLTCMVSDRVAGTDTKKEVVLLKNLLAAASAHHFISQKCSRGRIRLVSYEHFLIRQKQTQLKLSSGDIITAFALIYAFKCT
jgi:hypothetical protein